MLFGLRSIVATRSTGIRFDHPPTWLSSEVIREPMTRQARVPSVSSPVKAGGESHFLSGSAKNSLEMLFTTNMVFPKGFKAQKLGK